MSGDENDSHAVQRRLQWDGKETGPRRDLSVLDPEGAAKSEFQVGGVTVGGGRVCRCQCSGQQPLLGGSKVITRCLKLEEATDGDGKKKRKVGKSQIGVFNGGAKLRRGDGASGGAKRGGNILQIGSRQEGKIREGSRTIRNEGLAQRRGEHKVGSGSEG